MIRNEQARMIDAEISQWIGASNLDRATMVLDWCEKNGVEVASVMPKHLAAAMGASVYWKQGPSDYLDLVYALVAFLQSR